MTKQLLPHAAQLPPRQRHVTGASRRDEAARAIASLGPGKNSEEGQGCAAALLTPVPRVPSVCAEERSGWRKEGRAWLSAASLRGPRQPREPQVARSEAEGRRQWGRLFFADFLLAKQKKVRPPPGGTPGSRIQTNSKARTKPSPRRKRHVHPITEATGS